ncbi:hypothetical protein L228DRAFT_264427 [Xylona heveae TC161]|uniref:G-patch domain-containing protein n=1 Tax=Xylona heveae (strain CBS 132557 / TC161) TaxID=1328760 RepID=A0A165JB06_XYLHT|nr:hypothetical protein L228DRAFT_264427 [Xylona heveae TC161]KZF25993.1 hypothetical protein L228DRAFT_264427 [Xylona heveae TC161]
MPPPPSSGAMPLASKHADTTSAKAEQPQVEEGEEEEEEDYMSMVITEPEKPREKETYTQRRMRKQREAEEKGRVKSKKEREAEEKAAREAALSQSLDSSNKGFKMMKMMGFKEGGTLGKNEGEGRTEPIMLSMKEDRGGIGLDTERKRKFREEVEVEAKRVKAEEGDYRERVRQEREQKRMEGQIIGAQKVAEKFDTEAMEKGEYGFEQDEAEAKGEGKPQKDEGSAEKESAEAGEEDATTRSAEGQKAVPTRKINVLWRGLIRHQEEKERERRIRYDLHQSLSRLPTYNDPNEDDDDKRALGRANGRILEEDVEEEDPELDEFNALEPAERLAKLVAYLREKYKYCFWCKYQYPDESMDGCPGVTEEDHD